MKIVIISSGFLPVVDGVTVALYQRLRFLSQRGHEVLVLCPDYRPIAAVYPNWSDYVGDILPGIRVVSLPSKPFLGIQFERNLSRTSNSILQHELQEFKPDIIHVDEPDRLFFGLLNVPGVKYAQNKGIPCLGFYHTNFVDYIEDFFSLPKPLISIAQWSFTQIIRRVFNAYHATLVASPTAHSRVRKMGIQNAVCDRFLGVDVQAFQARSLCPQFFSTHYGIHTLDRTIKLVFLGRLTPDKGWRFALEAFADWVNHPDSAPWMSQIALIIAGDGEMRDEIEQRLQSLGFAVYLLGRISPNAVPPLLINSDIHITVSEKETLGLTILEAFAAGLPVIAPRAGGVVTLIRGRENGQLFAPQSVSSFRQSLLSLLSDASLRDRMGQQGQRDVKAYHWNAAVTNLLNTWQNQIAQHQL